MHPMKRAFLILFFGLGTVGGFAHGFASLAGHCGSSGHCGSRRASFEDHVAEVCARAAQRVNEEDRALDRTYGPGAVDVAPRPFGPRPFGEPGHHGH